MENPYQHIVAAAIVDERGRVLLARRPADVHQGGKWEFPGGKREAGESPAAALARELSEELGIEPVDLQPLIRTRHRYADKAILLEVWRVSRFRGAPSGREGQILRWTDITELRSLRFPAASRPAVTALQLPDRYLITPESANDTHFFNMLEAALKDGLRLVQLRVSAAHNPHERLMALAPGVWDLCQQYGARLLTNGEPAWAVELKADGVHLNRHRLMPLTGRPLPTGLWVAASCHNSDEIAQANAIGADFIVLSPVRPTTSHPDTEPLDWQEFGELCEQADCPVYALGGLHVSDIGDAKHYGGQGIAAIRSLWPD